VTVGVLLNFVATTWMLAILPGVGQALMLRQTLADGPRIAVATIFGTVTGLVIWSAAAGAGLSAALLADPAIYHGLLLAGGGVLIVIGLRTVLSAVRRPADGAPAHPDGPDTEANGRGAYLAGLATNLGNPKAGVFAISLLPAFAGVGGFLPTLGLGFLWAAVTAWWYLLFVLLVSRGRTFMTRPGTQRGLSGISGLVLVALGLAVGAGA
jgi:threonine/homoserine/homoserine lactone efflux protein